MAWRLRCILHGRVLWLGLVLILAQTAWAQGKLAGPASPYLEEWTSTELRERIANGTRTVLIPVGGTEQSGPHIVLGKHNVRVHLLAGRIAQAVGHTVVAPVLAYVPEGSIQPPSSHMRFAGTVSIPESVFEALLEASARSFKQHGFQHVFLLGDHGGYQKSLERVATKLNREWANDPVCRVHALLAYYQVTQTAFVDELKRRGFSPAEIGEHAGLADTSLSLALDKSLVRSELLASVPSGPGTGVSGDPKRASVDLGQWGVQRIVDTSAAAVKTIAGAR